MTIKVVPDEDQTEASEVYQAQLARQSNLRPDCQSEKEPWSHSQFTEAAVKKAIARIYAKASAMTLPYYQYGETEGDNWVIKWMLYHVCRYRDNRNKKIRGRGHNDAEEVEATSPNPPGRFAPRTMFRCRIEPRNQSLTSDDSYQDIANSSYVSSGDFSGGLLRGP
ncbi:uncharacterized protein KY384_004269 [Bacidia gigantensis]|uniref:uncharacterized protein n=1 Tax=Bacidia gigantensis TaxID=2732470 RepID=UPI001D052BF0|nr:uncharacterized protein KY384_004269 [Bacidia gigantensis]KAG8530912.1 hypothetical protein KY384_004269 [Bacidia gigantensis]